MSSRLVFGLAACLLACSGVPTVVCEVPKPPSIPTAAVETWLCIATLEQGGVQFKVVGGRPEPELVFFNGAQYTRVDPTCLLVPLPEGK